MKRAGLASGAGSSRTCIYAEPATAFKFAIFPDVSLVLQRLGRAFERLSRAADTGCKDFRRYTARQWRRAMKPYILGAIIVWFTMGITGAALLGQQRLDIATIAGGPIALWNGLNEPVN
jgi:hypothetical protein